MNQRYDTLKETTLWGVVRRLIGRQASLDVYEARCLIGPLTRFNRHELNQEDLRELKAFMETVFDLQGLIPQPSGDQTVGSWVEAVIRVLADQGFSEMDAYWKLAQQLQSGMAE